MSTVKHESLNMNGSAIMHHVSDVVWHVLIVKPLIAECSWTWLRMTQAHAYILFQHRKVDEQAMPCDSPT